jgi:hypothetical protein
MDRFGAARGEFAALASLVPRMLRAKWPGLIAFAVGLAGSAIWVLSSGRLYRSEAVILFERGAQTTALGHEPESARAIGARLGDAFTSRQRLESVIRELKLYPRLMEKKGRVETIDEMRKHVSLSHREGYAYRVSYDGETRQLAKEALDKLIASVIDADLKRRNSEADQTKAFLDAERQQADKDLKEKEQALAAFLTKHPQLAAETGAAAAAGGLIRAQDRDRAVAGGGDVSALEVQAAQLEEQIAAAGGPRAVVAQREAMADPELTAAHTRAQTELQAAQRDLAEKQGSLTNEHPDVKQALRRVTHAEAAEKRTAAALAAGTRTAAGGAARDPEESASNRTAALRRALAAIRSQIAQVRSRSAPRVEAPRAPTSVVEIDTDWTRLNREVSEARERQGQLEAKQFQAQLAATLISGGRGGRLVVADPPFIPMRPSAGGRTKLALVGGAASAVLGLVVMLIVAAFDDRLYGSRDVESVLPDGIVVAIPKVPPRLPAPAAAPASEPVVAAAAKEG